MSTSTRNKTQISDTSNHLRFSSPTQLSPKAGKPERIGPSFVSGLETAGRVIWAVRFLSRQGRDEPSPLVTRYGSFIGLLATLLLPNTATRYQRIEWGVLKNSDSAAVLAFRDALISECNMTAVAGAIMTQVAITGLSLQNLSSTHWVARAFFLIGVVSGCLSVYYACVLQRAVGELYRPSRVRSWLSRPSRNSEDEENDEDEEDLEKLELSLATVLIISAPFNMVKISIWSFLLGLTIYQAFVWTRALDTSAGPGDSRHVFIMYMAVTGVCVIFSFVIFSAKNFDVLLFGRDIRRAAGEGHKTARRTSTKSSSRVSVTENEQEASLAHEDAITSEGQRGRTEQRKRQQENDIEGQRQSRKDPEDQRRATEDPENQRQGESIPEHWRRALEDSRVRRIAEQLGLVPRDSDLLEAEAFGRVRDTVPTATE